MIATPLLREGTPIGVLSVARCSVRPFTDKQMALLTTFADQAVIAIENARLFDEVRARTDELSEALRQQTATADVLQVISGSAFDLQPVFDTVAESSVKLCEAERAFIHRYDGELLRMVAAFNSPPEFKEWVVQHPIRPGRHSAAARAALEHRTVHIPDCQSDSEYTYGAKDVEPVRSLLAVPILKGDDLLGVIIMYRYEVRPFTDKQIALVETFADQSAIAIENARRPPPPTCSRSSAVPPLTDRPALHYVFALPTFTSRRVFGVISFTPQGRQVPCIVHPSSSWPTPFWRSCWRARWQQPWSVAAPVTP